MVGAGSFPVTKRMPFVETAFDDASRRLAAHARCALFVGPLATKTEVRTRSRWASTSPSWFAATTVRSGRAAV